MKKFRGRYNFGSHPKCKIKNEILEKHLMTAAKNRQTETRHILIDTDAGIDDAWAIFMMLRAHQNPDVDLIIHGITCVNGNTKVDNVVTNVSRCLITMNETGIPVFRGAESAIAVEFVEDPPYMGEDGFGDAILQPIVPIVEEEHGVMAIIRLATEYKGNLSVLALGPLTNLALAINHSPKIKDYFKEIVMLGGNMESHGNVSPTAEFNFLTDVESARIVLDNHICPMIIFPLETFMRFGTTTYSFRVDELGILETSQIILMNQVEAKSFENNKETWSPADACAAAVLLEPSIVTKSETHYCIVELHGGFTRGMLVVDRQQFLEKPPNVIIITEINTELFQKMLVTAAGGPYYEP